MAQMKLAEALLRRKELQENVDRLRVLRDERLYGILVERVPASEGLDNVTAQVSRLSYEQVDAAYNFHAKQLRLVDGAIQQANWNTEIEVNDIVPEDYVEDPALIDTPLTKHNAKVKPPRTIR